MSRQLFQRAREISKRVRRRAGQLPQAVVRRSNGALRSRQVSLHGLDKPIGSLRISTRRCKAHFVTGINPTFLVVGDEIVRGGKLTWAH